MSIYINRIQSLLSDEEIEKTNGHLFPEMSYTKYRKLKFYIEVIIMSIPNKEPELTSSIGGNQAKENPEKNSKLIRQLEQKIAKMIEEIKAQDEKNQRLPQIQSTHDMATLAYRRATIVMKLLNSLNKLAKNTLDDTNSSPVAKEFATWYSDFSGKLLGTVWKAVKNAFPDSKQVDNNPLTTSKTSSQGQITPSQDPEEPKPLTPRG